MPFKRNEYFKYVNRIVRFLSICNKKPYVLVGSGSCAEKILQVIDDKSLQQPVGIFDEFNVGKSLHTFTVQSLSDLNLETGYCLIASIGFEESVRNKINQVVENANSVPDVAAISDFNEYRSKKTSKDPMIINAMPKTGSYFIQSTLEELLDIDHQGIAQGTWPNMEMSEANLRLCLNTCSLSVSHLQATSRAIALLKRYKIKKTIVHIRDPRQATLSWIHHLDKTKNTDYFSPDFFTIADYFDLDLKAKIDYQLRHFLPQACQYIADWMDAEKVHDIEVKFLEFSQMKNNPESFFADIYQFFGIHQPLGDVPLPKEGKLHYRKGLEDEWRNIFDANQIEAANKVVPQKFKDRFDWSD